MRTRRLEEIFEECLSAYLEGERAIGESLSLYPDMAGELEPLLRCGWRNAKGTLKLVSSSPSPISGKIVLALDNFRYKRKVFYLRIRLPAMDKERYQLLFTFRVQHRPGRGPRRLPGPTTTVHFLSAHGHKDRAGSFIAANHLELCP